LLSHLIDAINYPGSHAGHTTGSSQIQIDCGVLARERRRLRPTLPGAPRYRKHRNCTGNQPLTDRKPSAQTRHILSWVGFWLLSVLTVYFFAKRVKPFFLFFTIFFVLFWLELTEARNGQKSALLACFGGKYPHT
jgi:hypothetical protein